MIQTATMPSWLYNAYADEIAQVGPDSPNGYAGKYAAFGGRRQYSFNSEVYRKYANRVVKQLADRYASRTDLIHSWQVDNELGHEGSDLDFSQMALEAWRVWLKEKYDADIDDLNSQWGTIFWGANYGSFEEISLPSYTIPGASAAMGGFRSIVSPGMLLDYRRFRADSIASFAGDQVRIISEAQEAASIPRSSQEITTNSPGGVWGKAMNPNLFFNEMLDFVSYDNYPVWGGSLEPEAPSLVAMQLDMVRCWGRRRPDSNSFGGFTIAEQLIGAQGHDIIGFTPRPDQAVAWSAQTLAHGADSLLFFRFRAAAFGQEEFCYGILDQSTPLGTGRKWNEAKKVFSLAREHEKLWLAPLVARVAVVYDTDNIFAWQAQPQSTAFDFTDEAHRFYHPFWRNGMSVDVFSSERLVEVPLSNYDVILLPAPMMLSDSLREELKSFVLDDGGSLWVGFRADIKVSTNSQMRTDPSFLAKLAGVSVTEFESINVGMPASPLQSASTTLNDNGTTASGSVWRDGLSIIDETCDETESVWDYADDEFFGGLGLSAITRRQLSNGGEVVYVGTGIDPELLVPLATATLDRQGLSNQCTVDDGVIDPQSLERIVRNDMEGNAWVIQINHSGELVKSSTGVEIPPFGVVVEPVME